MPKTKRTPEIPHFEFRSGECVPPSIVGLRFYGVKLVSGAFVTPTVRLQDFGLVGLYLSLTANRSEGRDFFFEKKLDLATLPERLINTRRMFAAVAARRSTVNNVAWEIVPALLAECAQVTIGLDGWPDHGIDPDIGHEELGTKLVRLTIAHEGFRDELAVPWTALSRFLRLDIDEEE